MASLSLYSQFETNLMSNCKVIELLLLLKSAKAHGKNYIKVKPHLVRHLFVIVGCCYPEEKYRVTQKGSVILKSNNDGQLDLIFDNGCLSNNTYRVTQQSTPV